MLTFAAIDIGSNSVRLKIASVEQHRLKTLHEDREVVRLGESVFQTGVISPEAMANTIRALKRFQKAVQLHVADRVRVVATSGGVYGVGEVGDGMGCGGDLGAGGGAADPPGGGDARGRSAGALSSDRPGRGELRDYILR
jgi:hypothetical protein